MELKIECMRDGAVMPSYSRDGDAGMDLRACGISDKHGVKKLVIPPMGRVLIPTGIKLEIPEGYEVQIRSRSGMSLKQGLVVLNSPGTIDSGYRGEVGVILCNLSKKRCIVEDGDRIAQMVVAEYCKVTPVLAEVSSDTERGSGGFGSTGV